MFLSGWRALSAFSLLGWRAGATFCGLVVACIPGALQFVGGCRLLPALIAAFLRRLLYSPNPYVVFLCFWSSFFGPPPLAPHLICGIGLVSHWLELARYWGSWSPFSPSPGHFYRGAHSGSGVDGNTLLLDSLLLHHCSLARVVKVYARGCLVPSMFEIFLRFFGSGYSRALRTLGVHFSNRGAALTWEGFPWGCLSFLLLHTL